MKKPPRDRGLFAGPKSGPFLFVVYQMLGDWRLGIVNLWPECGGGHLARAGGGGENFWWKNFWGGGGGAKFFVEKFLGGGHGKRAPHFCSALSGRFGGIRCPACFRVPSARNATQSCAIPCASASDTLPRIPRPSSTSGSCPCRIRAAHPACSRAASARL